MKTLLIAADVDPSFREAAARDGRFDVVDRPVKTEDELAAIVGDAQILVTRSYNVVSRRVLDAAPKLELIAQGTSGTDNIDLATAREYEIAVMNLPGANANAVAELVLGFMIAMTRTVPQYTHEVAAMRPGCYLINASRGEVLDHHAALAALADNHLAGLALDVFDPEPPTIRFPDDPRLLLTPHIGGGTHEAKSAIGAKLYEK